MYRCSSPSTDRRNGDGVVTEEEYKSAFDRRLAGLIRTRLDGRGDVTATQVDAPQKGIAVPDWAAPLQGILYVIRTGGILSTFDPEKGKVLREER